MMKHARPAANGEILRPNRRNNTSKVSASGMPNSHNAKAGSADTSPSVTSAMNQHWIDSGSGCMTQCTS